MMFKCFLIASFVCLFTIVIVKSADDLLITPCWRCICEASTDCNTTIGCQQGFCGPMKLSWTYWKDSGKPTVNNEDPEKEEAYMNCANDIYCSIISVQRYTHGFAQDCNRDGVVDCDDYSLIHKLGGYACRSIVLPEEYVGRYGECKTRVGTLTV